MTESKKGADSLNGSERVIQNGGGTGIAFKNFDDSEETTMIQSIMPVRRSWLGALIVAPILSIITGLIFALCLFWMPKWRARFVYRRVDGLSQATHVVVTGVSKYFILRNQPHAPTTIVFFSRVAKHNIYRG